MGTTFNFSVYNECCDKHVHEYPQILVPLSDTLRICIGNIEYEVKPREVCFIPPELMHQCNFLSRLMVINIPSDVLERKDAGLLIHPLIIKSSDQITRLLELIREELKQNPNSKDVCYLYSYLYTKLLENCSTASMQYIKEHYDEPIKVTQLAEIENYNVTYFNDWFKQQTGFTPNSYIRYIRINKAKELLAETNLSIMEIAVMVGYGSNSTLTRSFHELMGMTPKAYRECPCFKKSRNIKKTG